MGLETRSTIEAEMVADPGSRLVPPAFAVLGTHQMADKPAQQPQEVAREARNDQNQVLPRSSRPLHKGTLPKS